MSEIDSLALSSVNDFLSYQKLARAALQGLPASTKGVFRNREAETAAKVQSIIGGNENHAVTHNDDEKHEGDCKVEALLVGETVDGYQHVRPLCTTSDVTLALFELADPDVFERGYIQLPHTLNIHYERWTGGYYRYIYRAKEESRLEYVV